MAESFTIKHILRTYTSAAYTYESYVLGHLKDINIKLEHLKSVRRYTLMFLSDLKN